MVRAVYVHVPFCLRKCRYCDFYSVRAAEGEIEAFAAAAAAELAGRDELLARPADTVFLGGGTPTAIGPVALGRLLEYLRPYIGEDTEVTVEANPGTLDEQVVSVLVAAGVKRVNVGAQSFVEAELRTLGRIHTAGQTDRAVELLRRAGLVNVGLDLIFGVPGQTLASWRGSLARAAGLGIEHLSCYGLAFEPDTPLGRDLAAGKVRQSDEELQRACYAAAVAAAEQAGMSHYEISNFARPGRQCRHNLTYWHNEQYVGIGPAAASFVGGRRWTNQSHLAGWRRHVEAGRRSRRCEHLTGRAAMAETLMLALRLAEGVDRKRFADRFGQDPVEAFSRAIGRYASQGALVVTTERIRLSPETFFTSNTVLADILAEA